VGCIERNKRVGETGMKWMFNRRARERQLRRETWLMLASIGGDGSDFFVKLANMVEIGK